MGGKRRRKRHHQNDDIDSQPITTHRNENPRQARGNGRQTVAEKVRLGSHVVTAPGTNYTNTIPSQPFQRTIPQSPHTHPRNNPRVSNPYNRNLPAHHPRDSRHDHNRNKRFKEYLLHTISETQREIELWSSSSAEYEEDGVSSGEEEEMDWQPEPEFVIVQTPQLGTGLMCSLQSQPPPGIQPYGLQFAGRDFKPRDLGGFWGPAGSNAWFGMDGNGDVVVYSATNEPVVLEGCGGC